MSAPPPLGMNSLPTPALVHGQLHPSQSRQPATADEPEPASLRVTLLPPSQLPARADERDLLRTLYEGH